MASDLDKIIDYYLWEQHRLQETVKEHLQNTDFNAAHIDQVALETIEAELFRLKHLQNPLFPKMDFIRRKIIYREEAINGINTEYASKEDQEYFLRYYTEDLQNLKKELKSLESVRPEEKKKVHHWDEAISGLWDKRPEGYLKLHFDREQNQYIGLHFKSESKMELVFHNFHHLTSSFSDILSNDLPFEVETMGNEESEKYRRITFSNLKEDALNSLKQVLAALIITANRNSPETYIAQLEIG